MKGQMLRVALVCMLCVLGLAVGQPRFALADQAVAMTTPDWVAPHVPGQLLVKLPADGVSAAAVAARFAGSGVQVLRTIPQLGLALVETAPTSDLNVAAQRLRAAADVEWVEPNYTFGLDLVPNDPEYAARQTPYLNRINITAAWDLNFGRSEIVVAVLDTGVHMSHPDLMQAIWVNPGEIPANGLDDDGNGFIDDVNGWDFAENDNLPDDDHGHGTHVAGIAAASINNGVGIAGVAGGATIMPVDVFRGGIGAYEDLIRAIIYATDNGAHVINMSLGASSYSRGEQMAVDYAVARNVVVVAAAGNTGNQTDHYPAAHPSVLAVAATTADDYLASFSTRGDFVDVAAPGYGIYSTYLGGGYATMSGTSMATPHVAGLAALLLARNPGLTPDQVRMAIEATADDLGPTGHDIYFGHGRINAGLALMKTTPSAELPEERKGPPLEIWPAGCQELIPDGGFETGLGAWQPAGAVAIDTSRAYAGRAAVHFAGGSDASGTLRRGVKLPANAFQGVIWFVYRIENQDRGWGPTPTWPFDDWLTVEFQSDSGEVIRQLLRTGNSADTASSGLPWDRYLYRIEVADMLALRGVENLNLVFRAQNDGDTLPTDFWVDEVRFCVGGARYQYFYPLWLAASPIAQ